MILTTPLLLLFYVAIELDDDISQVDKFLASYKPIHELFDAWLVLAVRDESVVFQWRLQAEVEMRNSGKPAMTDKQVGY
jgi:D-glycerate 3-kinase